MPCSEPVGSKEHREEKLDQSFSVTTRPIILVFQEEVSGSCNLCSIGRIICH